MKSKTRLIVNYFKAFNLYQLAGGRLHDPPLLYLPPVAQLVHANDKYFPSAGGGLLDVYGREREMRQKPNGTTAGNASISAFKESQTDCANKTT
ncbi:hypothetical protein EVAR_55078_1 [Eumeta japonica]|uniref:Uncharacterized protein n=1 Tax=Eumeta variegata TaxID=151549 RepID=A0A4C1Z0L0_EUMVA|nr:hypothetical protein EVAR_55078_1 [Eumeta japonica]